MGELTYKVRGADGKEYGPVLLEQLTTWIQQGRLPPQQPVKRSDMDYWVSAAEFAELQPAYTAANPAATDPSHFPGIKEPAGDRQSKFPAPWLYWAGGLVLAALVLYFLWRGLSGAGS